MTTITLDDIDVRTRVKIENRAKRAKKTPAEMAAFLLDKRVGVTPPRYAPRCPCNTALMIESGPGRFF